MANSNSILNNTIELHVSNTSPHVEGIVAPTNTVYPGMLCQYSGVGIAPYAVAGDRSETLIAVENGYSGGTIFSPYEEETRVMMRIMRPGDIFLTYVTDEASSSILAGGSIVSDGAGWFKVKTLATEVAVAISLETVSLSDFPRWTRVRAIH